MFGNILWTAVTIIMMTMMIKNRIYSITFYNNIICIKLNKILVLK